MCFQLKILQIQFHHGFCWIKKQKMKWRGKVNGKKWIDMWIISNRTISDTRLPSLPVRQLYWRGSYILFIRTGVRERFIAVVLFKTDFHAYFRRQHSWHARFCQYFYHCSPRSLWSISRALGYVWFSGEHPTNYKCSRKIWNSTFLVPIHRYL